MNLLDLMDGTDLREDGVGRVDAAEPEDWKARADRAILELAATREPFSADDVRDRAGDPVHPNAMGARLLAAAKRGSIERVGLIRSTRPSCHAHLNPAWKGIA